MLNQKGGFLPALASLIAPLAIDLLGKHFQRKHAQKMVMIPEHLLQSMETEHRLTAPARLTTLTRLDQGMKQIMDSFPRRSKSLIAGPSTTKVPRVDKTNEK